MSTFLDNIIEAAQIPIIGLSLATILPMILTVLLSEAESTKRKVAIGFTCVFALIPITVAGFNTFNHYSSITVMQYYADNQAEDNLHDTIDNNVVNNDVVVAYDDSDVYSFGIRLLPFGKVNAYFVFLVYLGLGLLFCIYIANIRSELEWKKKKELEGKTAYGTNAHIIGYSAIMIFVVAACVVLLVSGISLFDLWMYLQITILIGGVIFLIASQNIITFSDFAEFSPWLIIIVTVISIVVYLPVYWSMFSFT